MASTAAVDVGDEFARKYFGAICSRQSDALASMYSQARSEVIISAAATAAAEAAHTDEEAPERVRENTARMAQTVLDVAAKCVPVDINKLTLTTVASIEAPGQSVVVTSTGAGFVHTAVLQQNNDGPQSQGGKSYTLLSDMWQIVDVTCTNGSNGVNALDIPVPAAGNANVVVSPANAMMQRTTTDGAPGEVTATTVEATSEVQPLGTAQAPPKAQQQQQQQTGKAKSQQQQQSKQQSKSSSTAVATPEQPISVTVGEKPAPAPAAATENAGGRSNGPSLTRGGRKGGRGAGRGSGSDGVEKADETAAAAAPAKEAEKPAAAAAEEAKPKETKQSPSKKDAAAAAKKDDAKPTAAAAAAAAKKDEAAPAKDDKKAADQKKKDDAKPAATAVSDNGKKSAAAASDAKKDADKKPKSVKDVVAAADDMPSLGVPAAPVKPTSYLSALRIAAENAGGNGNKPASPPPASVAASAPVTETKKDAGAAGGGRGSAGGAGGRGAGAAGGGRGGRK